ncbi:MAG: phosphohistidine phosphatase SixA [Sulfuricella sp.]|nr:phosphohistidine phosphatase SixA [Sulfuricella sp.]
MDLILWRHADAQDGEPDMDRALTAKGKKQAERVAQWLRMHIPEDTVIFCSPALRATQTADALGKPYKVAPEISPGEDVTHLLVRANWPSAKGAVLLVGHQPTLGQATGLILLGEAASLSIKKGGVVWLTNRTRGELQQTVLKAAMTPELL